MGRIKTVLALFLLLATPLSIAGAQDLSSLRYQIGSPTLTELWVDGTHGNDAADGRSQGTALRTVTEAWNRIPNGVLTGTGYRINVVGGVYTPDQLPTYWEQKQGSAAFPIILRAAPETGTVIFQAEMNVFQVAYLYVLDITIAAGGDGFHCEQCQVTLLRHMVLDGGARQAHDLLKVNQSQYFYVEDSDIHGADDNSVDFVSVQYGHVVNNRIHDSEDWCLYAKGGSAYLVVADNEVYNCGTGGITAGQGTGFEFMTPPWIHYEAYDLKIVNNIIHDTEGAGLGVNGGYNILLAFNTLVRIGSRSHVIEIVYGARDCDGDSAACTARNTLGGWGSSVPGTDAPIGNRDVLVVNNLVYNPAPFRSGYQQFAIYGQQTPPVGTNIPSPQVTDARLVIRGNLIWNGGASMPLGVEDSDQGCQPGNPTCTAAQIAADNIINTIEPQLIDVAANDLRPAVDSNVIAVSGVAIPSFLGDDRVTTPLAPQGNLMNTVPADRGGVARSEGSNVVGAYRAASSPLTLPAELDDSPGPIPTPMPTTAPAPVPTPSHSGDTIAPQIKKVRVSKRKIRSKKTISFTATVTDNVGVQSVWAEAVGAGTSSLKGRHSTFTGSIRLSPKGNFQLLVHAIDTSGNESTADAGSVVVR